MFHVDTCCAYEVSASKYGSKSANWYLVAIQILNSRYFKFQTTICTTPSMDRFQGGKVFGFEGHELSV